MKKYLFTLLKVLIFLAVVWLIYFFEILFSAKMLQDQQYLVSSLLSYLGLIVLSIPFWTILSTCIFFGFQMSFDKLFSFRIIPIIAAMNAVLLLVFFLVKIPVASYNQSSDFYAVPTVREGYINAFNGMTFFPKKLSSDTIYEGFLFQDAAYFIDSGKINRDTVSFSASRAIGDYSLISKNISISMTTKVKLATMPESGISRWILSQYFEQLKTMKNIFESSFSVGGIFFAILAILLLAVGFYAIVSAISYFLNERQIFILSISSLVIVSIISTLGLKVILSLVEIVKLGMNQVFGQAIVPSLVMTILLVLIAFGLILLKDLLIKKQKEAIR